MANKNKKTQQTEEKRDVKIPVTCMTCKHSALHRYDCNPILAACHKKPQPENVRFPFEVDVASVLRICKEYSEETNEKTVEQRYRNYVA